MDVSAIRNDEKSDLLLFIANNFPADWYFRAKEVLERGINKQASSRGDQTRLLAMECFLQVMEPSGMLLERDLDLLEF